MKFKRNTGITLIALVVTIIVLLILAGITLSLALNNNGIFQRSKNAAAAYSEAEEAERAELDRIAGEMDEIMGVLPPLEIPEGLEEGAKIIYKPEGRFHWNAELASSIENDGSTTLKLGKITGKGENTSDYDVIDMNLATGEELQADTEDMNISEWEVVSLDKENGKAVIVPTDSTIKMDDTPSGYVFLQGAQGYNNIVKLLNDACEALYGNPQKGVRARSINIEDIEKILDEKVITNENSEEKTVLQLIKENDSYGQRPTTEYTQYKKFPAIYASEKNSIVDGILNTNGLDLSKQNSYIKRNESIKIGSNTYTATNGFVEATSIKPEQTYYKIDSEVFEYVLGEENKIIGSSWLASRSIQMFEKRCEFGNKIIAGGELGYGWFCSSDGSVPVNAGAAGLFPIVTLESGIISENESGEYVFSTN